MMNVGSSHLSLHSVCDGFAGHAFEDQSLFGRTGLFALMKEPKVVPALVIICLDSSFNTHTHSHTCKYPQAANNTHKP